MVNEKNGSKIFEGFKLPGNFYMFMANVRLTDVGVNSDSSYLIVYCV